MDAPRGRLVAFDLSTLRSPGDHPQQESTLRGYHIGNGFIAQYRRVEQYMRYDMNGKLEHRSPGIGTARSARHDEEETFTLLQLHDASEHHRW